MSRQSTFLSLRSISSGNYDDGSRGSTLRPPNSAPPNTRLDLFLKSVKIGISVKGNIQEGGVPNPIACCVRYRQLFAMQKLLDLDYNPGCATADKLEVFESSLSNYWYETHCQLRWASVLGETMPWVGSARSGAAHDELSVTFSIFIEHILTGLQLTDPKRS